VREREYGAGNISADLLFQGSRSTKLMGQFAVPSGVPKSSVHGSKKGYKTISHIKSEL
jgi:hypothetical protein